MFMSGSSGALQGGNVWEKAGVNVSVVYGSMPADAYRAATGAGNGVKNLVRAWRCCA